MGENFTGLNHFRHDSVINSTYSEYFGFTEHEVHALINKLIELNCLNKSEIIRKTNYKYNGY